ncbi:cyclic GMP-AMP synthase isoform X2 [Melopsittacus undulatus]|uniref:cyclic GMP-AMP synthase isoform X2 n=1 Tax=Melopsittacus undulatus TaxID=13146 RepID=UPI00146E171F|nr:cyclic GMP-AMP synthase isoform X2 [Melopsittacus undulatus]
MDGASGRKPKGGRGTPSAAPRGRGKGGNPSGTATAREPRRVGSTSHRRPSTVKSLPAGPPASGAEKLPALRSETTAASVPAVRRRVAVADGEVSAPGAVLPTPSVAEASDLRKVVSRLTLVRKDISEASELVNKVASHLIQALHSNGGRFSSIKRLNAGSYYEHVKISEPNEFDIMLVMPIERLQMDECDDTGAYYYLTFKRNPKERYLFKFLDEAGKLSALKMLQELREIIKQVVKTITDVEVTVQRKKAGSPAITLQIKKPPAADISVDIIPTLEVQQNWPPSTQDGLKVETWLGRKVKTDFRKESIYFVAKQNKKEKVLRGKIVLSL